MLLVIVLVPIGTSNVNVCVAVLFDALAFIDPTSSKIILLFDDVLYVLVEISLKTPFSSLFHQYLDVEQLFPICFGAFFAGNAPEVFPDFVVEGIDFGGLGVGDGAIGGAVHFVLLSANKLYKRRCF